MARPRTGQNLYHEAQLAQIALAGVRILAQDSVAPDASDSADYEVTLPDTRRLVCFHNSGVNTDIRVALNETAVATDFPVASGVYFVLEVEEGDSVSFFNTAGTAVTVYVIETR